MNESFWDAHGVEIGACAILHYFYRSAIRSPIGKNDRRSDVVGHGFQRKTTQSIRFKIIFRISEIFLEFLIFLKIFENSNILRTPLRCSATASSFGPKCPLGRSPNGHFGTELSTLLRAAQGCAQNLGIFVFFHEFNFF